MNIHEFWNAQEIARKMLHAGFYVRSAHDGSISLRLQEDVWPELRPDTEVEGFDTVEEAHAFVKGVLWCKFIEKNTQKQEQR